MLIKCQNCGHENMLGAIFCRNCGEKLEIDKMRPEIQHNKKKGGGFIGFLQRLITLVILLGLIAVIVGLFIPENVPIINFPNDAKAIADKKFKELLNRVDEGFGTSKFTFTPEEITYLCNSKLITAETQTSQGAYNIESMLFFVDQAGYIHCILKVKLAGKIPTTFEIKGVLNGSTSPISITVTEAKMGKVPIKFIENVIVKKFNPLLDDPRLSKILESISKANLTEDKKIVIILAEKTL